MNDIDFSKITHALERIANAQEEHVRFLKERDEKVQKVVDTISELLKAYLQGYAQGFSSFPSDVKPA